MITPVHSTVLPHLAPAFCPNTRSLVFVLSFVVDVRDVISYHIIASVGAGGGAVDPQGVGEGCGLAAQSHREQAKAPGPCVRAAAIF